MERLLANPHGYWVLRYGEFEGFRWFFPEVFFLYDATARKAESLLAFACLQVLTFNRRTGRRSGLKTVSRDLKGILELVLRFAFRLCSSSYMKGQLANPRRYWVSLFWEKLGVSGESLEVFFLYGATILEAAPLLDPQVLR